MDKFAYKISIKHIINGNKTDNSFYQCSHDPQPLSMYKFKLFTILHPSWVQFLNSSYLSNSKVLFRLNSFFYFGKSFLLSYYRIYDPFILQPLYIYSYSQVWIKENCETTPKRKILLYCKNSMTNTSQSLSHFYVTEIIWTFSLQIFSSPVPSKIKCIREVKELNTLKRK